MVSKREYKNILNFVVLQICALVFCYLSYCLFKDWKLYDGKSMDVPLHATIGLAAHLCIMTCGIFLIQSDNFCARQISPSSRMMFHGCIMLFGACNSMLSFFHPVYVVDYLSKVQPGPNDLKDTFGSVHVNFAVTTIIAEFLTVGAGYFLYKCRSIMDIKRAQRCHILWLHNILGYFTYTFGICTLVSGLFSNFIQKDTALKYYTLTGVIIVLVGCYVLLLFIYKVVKHCKCF